jgi:hypothetical protein
MQGEGDAVMHVRCRAPLRGLRSSCGCAHFRTCVALSACRACTSAVRAQAGEGSTGGAGGGWPLGIEGGVQGMSRARQQREACLLRLSPLGCARGGIWVSKTEGQVGLVRSLAGGVERDRAGRWLNVDWGCRVAVVQESRGGDLGKIASGISHPLCPSAKGQGEERGE